MPAKNMWVFSGGRNEDTLKRFGQGRDQICVLERTQKAGRTRGVGRPLRSQSGELLPPARGGEEGQEW